MKAQARQYLAELLGTMAVYVVVLFASVWLLNAYPDSAARIPVALAPMLPALALPFVVVRHLRRLDELQRQLQLDALGFAFAGTAILTFGYGFLEIVGFPRLSSFTVWPVMAGLWVVGLAIANRRFR